jgi:peptidoglycan/LPS O-acetylase OafA/YrhL
MKHQRLAGLDALRGVAALGVALYHFSFCYAAEHPGFAPSVLFEFGKYGVDLFFAISGFVIYMTLQRSASVVDFVVSRFARLYPVFWVALLIAATLRLMDGGSLTIGTVLANATMMPSLFGAPFLDPVYWTLGYEFRFYVLAAGFLLSRSNRVEFACLGWLLIAVLVMAYTPIQVMLVIVAPYADLFVVGIMVYRLHHNPRNLSAWLVLATSILVAERVPFASDVHINGLSNTAVVCAFAAALWFGARAMVPRPLAHLGEISYALYLLHDPVGSLLLNTGHSWGVPADLAIVAALLGSISVAGFINATVERPAQRWIKKYMGSRDGSRALVDGPEYRLPRFTRD